MWIGEGGQIEIQGMMCGGGIRRSHAFVSKNNNLEILRANMWSANIIILTLPTTDDTMQSILLHSE